MRSMQAVRAIDQPCRTRQGCDHCRMGRLVGRRLAAALCLVAVAIGALLLSRMLSHKGLDWAAKFSEVTSFVIAVIGLLVAPLGKITDWLRGPRPPTIEEIASDRKTLHSVLNAAWNDEEPEIYLDMPMQVRFGPWADLASRRVSPGGAPPGGASTEQSLAGDFGSIVDAFSNEPKYRRVILGGAGAGKTVLVTELQRKLLESPDRAIRYRSSYRSQRGGQTGSRCLTGSRVVWRPTMLFSRLGTRELLWSAAMCCPFLMGLTKCQARCVLMRLRGLTSMESTGRLLLRAGKASIATPFTFAGRSSGAQ